MKDKDIAKTYCCHWFKGTCVNSEDEPPCDPGKCDWFKNVVQKCHALDAKPVRTRR